MMNKHQTNSKFEIRNSKLRHGNAWVGIIILLTFLTTLGLALVSDATLTIIQSKRAAQLLVAQSLCDAGVEKTVFKLNDTGGSYTGELDLNLETGIVDIEVVNLGTESKDVIVTAYVPSKANAVTERKVRARISATTNETGLAFNYGVQAGEGGFTLSNNAILNGNVYSAGAISCGNTASITGDAYVSRNSLGAYGEISNCKIGGNAEAYDILGSDITGWGKYVGSRNGTTADGGLTQITQSQLDDDIPFISMSITEPTIQSWESWANDGGTFSGNYTLGVGQVASIGPKKIDGNLTLSSGSVLTLTGVVWVKGNIILNAGSSLRLSPSYGPNSGLLIADQTDDRVNDGYVIVNSNVTIQGSGAASSYILIVSTNEKTDTADPAVFAGNNSDAVVYYTSQGMITVNNNAHLKAISGGGIYVANGAVIDYDSGLASANFSGGPGGSWTVTEWQILH
jgi:hypothetical protein